MQHLERNPTLPLEIRNGTWHPWYNSKISPTCRSHSRGTRSFLAQFNLSPLSPPYLDKRVDSPAFLERDPDIPFAPQEEASLTLKIKRKPRGSCHMPKDTNFPVHSRQVTMSGHLLECNPEDEVTTRRGTDTSVASSGKSHSFQIQLYKWPDTPWTTREASGVPFLNTRWGLTPLFQLRRDP